MKALLTLSIALTLSFSSFADVNDWYFKYIRIIDVELNDHLAQDILQQWVGITEEDNATYLYNLTTKNIFCEFKSGIKTAQIQDVITDSGTVHVRLVVNEFVMINVALCKQSGKVIYTKASHI
ncbi:hypothetical protein [Flammeovirga sp. SubArs3]|uniref:hypothetical protein n=1 Tax=Flammeovirga sp. SubArs3 TaxID=2995316 RepID=UPI00248BC23C|nr:hypothetical protein [Flammeovirga sp. SubArs3]